MTDGHCVNAINPLLDIPTHNDDATHPPRVMDETASQLPYCRSLTHLVMICLIRTKADKRGKAGVVGILESSHIYLDRAVSEGL